MQTLDGISRVDDRSHFRRLSEERDDLLPLPAPYYRYGRELRSPRAGFKLVQGGRCAVSVGRVVKSALRAPASSLRSFHDASVVELRIRCTMHVWICACGYTASMASGKPRRPSATAMRMSCRPRFFSLLQTFSQNLALQVRETASTLIYLTFAEKTASGMRIRHWACWA